MEDLNKKELEALKIIRNSIVHNGSKPTYNKLMELLDYKSPRSVNIIIRSLTDKGYLKNDEFGRLIVENYPEIKTTTINVQVLGQVACGQPILADEIYGETISISTMIAKPPHTYYVLRARGDSMDKRGIKDGDLVLIRKQPTANNGQVVVGLIDNECTLKEFYRNNDYIILKPNSFNSENKPMLLTSDFTILGVMVDVLPQM
ncbi:MAG: repressor LexA [Ignavibacteriae bacterium]|nr:repressor LexA [Ignavibacteriota bacterium]